MKSGLCGLGHSLGDLDLDRDRGRVGEPVARADDQGVEGVEAKRAKHSVTMSIADGDPVASRGDSRADDRGWAWPRS